jgi:CBS domain-containing protein
MLTETYKGCFMKVGSICQRNVATVRALDDLTAAARIMREKHVGYLVVIEPELASTAARPIGVLTDRDIVVTVVARETDPRALRVGDVMTQQPIVIGEEAAIETALEQMRRSGVRRLPVVGQRGELLGVLSLDEVLSFIADEMQNVSGSVRNERQIEGAFRP